MCFIQEPLPVLLKKMEVMINGKELLKNYKRVMLLEKKSRGNGPSFYHLAFTKHNLTFLSVV